MKAGQSANATFTMTPTAGHLGTVSFSCLGLPTGAACQFAPATLTANGSSTAQSSVLTVTVTGLNSGHAMNHTVGSTSSLLAIGLPGAIFGFAFLQRRRSLGKLLLAGFAALLVLSTTNGCGGGLSGALTSPGVSVVTVTAVGTATATGTSPGNSAGNASEKEIATFTLNITQ